ncbi:MAG: RsmE family RNA methyltransferase [bacterium]|nr:RsmE family RNA methyltransferase [bacterium]
MSYFLSDKPLQTEEIIELTGDEARHILLSRRMEVGEIIEIQGPDQKRFNAEVVLVDRKSLSIQALEEIPTPKESPLSITIFQALIKEQPLDFIIQKSTELGVDKLFLFNSENSIERFKEIEKKLDRWRKIGEEAAKQSGRVRAVSIEYIDDPKDIYKLASELDHIFLLEPLTKDRFSTWELSSQVNKIGILVGPEGGFTEEEVVEFSKIKNVIPISMGPRILRADTAAITSSAIVQALWGDV